MPIFEFECPNCKAVLQLMSWTQWEIEAIREGRLSPECPKCKWTTQRVISLSNFKVGGNYRASNGYSIVRGNECNGKTNA